MENDAAQQAEFVSQIARHQAVLHAFIISLMPGMDGVDDVLQETNIVLWEKRSAFKLGTNFQAWACQIARYKVMSHRRKLANLGHQAFDDELATLLAEECEATPDELDSRMQALNKCISRLSSKEREMVEHRYFKEEPLEDFARQYGHSVESIRVMLFRIRAGLKKCITSEIHIQQAR